MFLEVERDGESLNFGALKNKYTNCLFIAQYALSTEEIKNIKMFAIQHRHRVTQHLHSDLRSLFRYELQLLTTYHLKKRVFELSGWTST